MRKNTYSKILMAPLFMLLAVACSPNQFNQSTEYDDVYFTASDRSTAIPKPERASRTVPVQSQEKTAVLESYSPTQVDEQLVTKYNNGTDNTVTYYEPGPLVTRASELNYDDFVADYNNEQLEYYVLPLDWNTDWNRRSFNRLVRDDFQFRLAWYDQYYRNQSFRMSQYLSGNFGAAGRRGMFGGPQIGLSVGFGNVFLGYADMAFVDLNPWGWYDPFFQPIGFRNRWAFNRGWGWNRWNRWDNFGWGWNDPFWCPPVGVAWNGGWGWRGGWNNNVFVNNNIFIDRRADRIFATNTRSGRAVVRGPRVSTSRVSTVRNEVINGTAPTTRSSRYADNLGGQRGTAVVNSRSGRANTGTGSRSNNIVSRGSRSTVSNGRANQTRTSAYRFEDSGRSGRSSYVRNNGSTSSRSATSRSTRATTPREGSRSVSSSRSSRSQSNPSFNRSSSSRSYGTSRTSRSYGNDSGARSSRSSSSSRNAYSRGSSSRSSYSNSRSSSSRSRGSSYSRGSSSRSSSGSRSMSRGSSSRSSSRSSGSISRGSSSRSSGSRSSSSRSSSSRSSSSRSGVSRSGRGN